jgi:acetoin utilization deacetylase AcuC-like enzyme
MLVVHAPPTLDHRVPPGFPETPERVVAIVRGLAADPRFRVESSTFAGREAEVLDAVARLHDAAYVERFRRAAARGDGLLDGADNPLCAASFAATVAATGAALAALECTVEGAEPVFAAIRPPGHHAERAHAMGFCFFNHAAVAAQRARERHGCERVAIVDVDVHHGNGTQHLFESRDDVLYASLHQWPFYPGTGAAEERGRGDGEGFTVNVPLAAGGGDEAWLGGLDDLVVPTLERFAPDLLVVSAGFDAWRGDPLGGMRVTAAGFAAMGERLFGFAARRCGGRALALLEGGYDVAALPALTAAFLTGSAAGEGASGG